MWVAPFSLLELGIILSPKFSCQQFSIDVDNNYPAEQVASFGSFDSVFKIFSVHKTNEE